jgi:hypothetical protein
MQANIPTMTSKVAGATITCIERITSYVDANGGFDTIWVLYIAWALASGAVLPVQVRCRHAVGRGGGGRRGEVGCG